MIAPHLLRGATRSSASARPCFGAKSKAAVAFAPSAFQRNLATEAQDTRPQAKAAATNSSMNVHTVEELHSQTAHEILREGGTRKEAAMRHFTVNFG